MNFKIIPIAVLLSACTSINNAPPVYGCEGLAEYGCPDNPGQPDDTNSTPTKKTEKKFPGDEF